MLIKEFGLYQNQGAELLIQYPEWLTINDTNCKGKKISVSSHGRLTTPIRFHVNDNQFYFTDKDCLLIVPQMQVAQSETQAYEYYVASRDSSPFYSGKNSIEIVPSYLSPSGEIDFDSNSILSIRLENWFWYLVRNMYVIVGSLGTTTLLYLVNYLVHRKKH
jgi:hypothetical protein